MAELCQFPLYPVRLSWMRRNVPTLQENAQPFDYFVRLLKDACLSRMWAAVAVQVPPIRIQAETSGGTVIQGT